MAGRRQYPPKRRAFAYLQLIRNDWNVSRAAKDAHVPEQTVREWANRWKVEGPEAELLMELSDSADDFLENAERIRNLALERLEEVIPESTSVRELTVAIGILDDKISRHKDIRDLTTPAALPAGPKGPKELQEAIGGMFIEAVAQAASRQQEIVEAEVVEPADELGLPSPLTEE